VVLLRPAGAVAVFDDVGASALTDTRESSES